MYDHDLPMITTIPFFEGLLTAASFSARRKLVKKMSDPYTLYGSGLAWSGLIYNVNDLQAGAPSS